MIIRIQDSGGSFRGAGKYYLHDKAGDKSLPNELKPNTDERVWFTDVRNCAHLDPERALDEMWAVAEDQAYLKQANGISTAGRRCTEPVKTISLSWHKDDAPTPEHMVDAADQYLRHMKWDQHQAVYVGHRDTEHRHIHIILNRVHPETGRTLDDYREQKRSQQWGLAYERQQDKIRCEAREANVVQTNEFLPERHRDPRQGKMHSAERDRSKKPKRDRKPANQHLPHNVIDITRASEKQFQAAEAERHDRDAAARADLKAEQRAEREAWFEEGKQLFKELRHAVYDEVRREHRREWRQYYKDAHTARKEADTWNADVLLRAAYFAREGDWEHANEAFHLRDSVRDAAEEKLREQFVQLRDAQMIDLHMRQHLSTAELMVERERQYAELLQRQGAERAAQQAEHAREKSGRTGPDSAADRGTSNDNRDDARPHEARDRAENASRNSGAHRGHANENTQDAGGPQENRGYANSDQRETRDEAARGDGNESGPRADANATPPRSAADIFETIEPVVEKVALTAAAEIKQATRDEHSTVIAENDPTPPEQQTQKQGADLAAGAIGSVASYLADQMAEAFAPTPPEVREANARAEAKREAEAPPREEKPDRFARQIEAALKVFEEERQGKSAQEYWAERERGKDRERDR